MKSKKGRNSFILRQRRVFSSLFVRQFVTRFQMLELNVTVRRLSVKILFSIGQDGVMKIHGNNASLPSFFGEKITSMKVKG